MPWAGWTTLNTDMGKIFFTADTHFWNEDAIRNGLRDFTSVEDMNKALIENWNSVVSDADDIFHLGNFSSGDAKQNLEILSQLNGRKHLILGNTDWKMLSESSNGLEDYWLSVEHYLELQVKELKIVLSHYPMLVWNESHAGSWMLHGMCHGGANLLNLDCNRHDVGVDNCEYRPIEVNEIYEVFASRQQDLPAEEEKSLIYIP